MKKLIVLFLCTCTFYFGFSQTPLIAVSADSAGTCLGNTTPITLKATLGSYSGYTPYLNASENSSGKVTCNCPPGYVAVGFHVRSGQWMDQIQLACKKLNPDGTLDPNIIYTSSAGGYGGENNGYATFNDDNTVLTGANLTRTVIYGSYASNITGYGQPISNIIAGNDNSYAPVALNTVGANAYYTNAGTTFSPPGTLITGMTVVVENYVVGMNFRYSSINELLNNYTINWSNGETGSSISVLPTETTKYIATVTNSAGQSASDSQTIEIHPLLAPDITASGVYFCPGGNITVSVPDGYASYQWNNGATTPSIAVSQSGPYSVTVTTANSCTATSSATIKAIASPNSADVYVDSSVNNSGEGTSWATAFKTLQDAIDAANGCTVIKNIWVAKGTYTPATGNDRDSAFAILRGGLKIYGGYASGGGARNITANSTILSGDIGTANDNSDNSYHVVAIAGLPADADSLVLDGFTVTGGNANGTTSVTYGSTSTYDGNGGGFYIVNNANNGKIALRNLVVTNNHADYVAGGLEINNTSPVIENCVISNNSSNYLGGGMFNEVSAAPIVTNCLFVSNSSDKAGGMYNYASSPAITNCTFYANSSNGGTGIYNDNSSSVITNCIIWGNTGENGGIYSSNESPVISFSDVQDGYTGTGNINADPLFVDAANNNLRLQACSPAINAGDNGYNSTEKDLDGNPRIANTIIDMGAYEYQAQTGPAAIINMPQPVTVCLGQQVKFSVTATGANLSFQWQKNGVNIDGATDSVYTIASATAADADNYSVIVFGCGTSVTSDDAQLTVNAATVPVVIVTNNCGSSTLSTTATGSLLWSTEETTSSITVSNAGNYSVTQIVDGCTSDAGSATASPKAIPAKPAVSLSGPASFCSGESVTLSVAGDYAAYTWSNGETTSSVTITQSGTYRVTVANEDGCSSPASDDITVTAHPLPQTPTITAQPSLTVCAGGTTTLTASAAAGYLWSNDSTTQSITVGAGTYSVTVSNENGCSSTSATVTVTTESCPPPTGLSITKLTQTKVTFNWQPIACAEKYILQGKQDGKNVLLAYTTKNDNTSFTYKKLKPGKTYQWRMATICSTNPEVISEYTPFQSFTTPAGSAINSMADSAALTVESNLSATVYPNPSVSNATLAVQNASGDVKIYLTDLTGKMLWKKEKVADKIISIPVSNLTNGTYLLIVQDGKQKKVLKLVKAK